MKKSILVLLAACMALCVSCEKETVSGEMIYQKGYVQTEYQSTVSSGTPCAELLKTVSEMMEDRILVYNEKWSVRFSGSSADSALAAEDKKAVSDFDFALKNLKSWKTQIDDLLEKYQYGPGSFKMTYVVRVWRNKELKVSEPITVEYRYVKP